MRVPPIEPTQYIRTIKLNMIWSAGMAGTPDDMEKVCVALNASHVRIEREIEDCIDDGLRGKKFDDTNTRVRIAPLVNTLEIELSVQVTFASLVAETVEQVMTVANKVAECAGAVLCSHTKRIDARVMEQHRQVKLVRTPATVVQAEKQKPANAVPDTVAPSQRLMMLLVINMVISLMALAGTLLLFVLMLFRR